MNQPAAKGPPPAIVQVDQLFKQHRRAIVDALPKHVAPDRMVRIALTELRKTYKLQQCDPMSFLGAIVQASQLGLEPGGALGHCYLIPYGREVQLQIGYKGMIDLARRSGNIVSISARCVYEGDFFEYEMGTEEYIKHKPAGQTMKMTHVYAVAQLKDGGVQFEILGVNEVNHIRDTYSQGYKRDPKNSPWATAYDEMAKKTAVRRLFKMLPTSIEIRDAIRVDEDEAQQNAKVIDPEYEVLPAAVDAEKFAEAQSAPEAPLQTAPAKQSADADRTQAFTEFNLAVAHAKSKSRDPEKLLGRALNEVLSSSTDQIWVAVDLLRLAK